MKNLQSVTKTIQSAVPEIMELKFGCEIESKDGLRSKLNTEKWIYDYSLLRDWELKNKEVKILGRPITLEDVLVALERVGESYMYKVTSDGHIYEIKRETEDGEYHIEPTGKYWQLGKPLSDQSPECINFLDEIL